jgi:hypothetical protein
MMIDLKKLCIAVLDAELQYAGVEERDAKLDAVIAAHAGRNGCQGGACPHASDCAVHNGEDAGPCDCGASGGPMDIKEIMEQAQVFASAWSLVGGRFDDGSMLGEAETAKAELSCVIARAIEQRATAQEPVTVPDEQAQYAVDPHFIGVQAVWDVFDGKDWFMTVTSPLGWDAWNVREALTEQRYAPHLNVIARHCCSKGNPVTSLAAEVERLRAIEQRATVQEPVAWLVEYADGDKAVVFDKPSEKVVIAYGDMSVKPLYLAPPPVAVPDDLPSYELIRDLLVVYVSAAVSKQENKFTTENQWEQSIDALFNDVPALAKVRNMLAAAPRQEDQEQ